MLAAQTTAVQHQIGFHQTRQAKNTSWLCLVAPWIHHCNLALPFVWNPIHIEAMIIVARLLIVYMLLNSLIKHDYLIYKVQPSFWWRTWGSWGDNEEAWGLCLHVVCLGIIICITIIIPAVQNKLLMLHPQVHYRFIHCSWRRGDMLA